MRVEKWIERVKCAIGTEMRQLEKLGEALIPAVLMKRRTIFVPLSRH